MSHGSFRTYSNSKGSPLIPRSGLEIQCAIWPSSITGVIRFFT